PFGGTNIITPGDFFQYAPVGGSALYMPMSSSKTMSNKEITKRLGHLAWKSFNSAIMFDEQEQMREDEEYTDAVKHLRTCSCTLEDLELFNSR
ncbi:hypothetical protein DFH29DRAFT_760305, partial [Suillus ampliporus]